MPSPTIATMIIYMIILVLLVLPNNLRRRLNTQPAAPLLREDLFACRISDFRRKSPGIHAYANRPRNHVIRRGPVDFILLQFYTKPHLYAIPLNIQRIYIFVNQHRDKFCQDNEQVFNINMQIPNENAEGTSNPSQTRESTS